MFHLSLNVRSIRLMRHGAIAIFGLACVYGPLGHVVHAAPPGPPPPDQEAIEELHDELGELAQGVGGLTKEEQAKVDALEKAFDAKAKANPNPKVLHQALDDVLPQYRALLNSAHQAKFDQMMAEQKAERQLLATHSRLKLIWTQIETYATQHKDALPPDLGTLVGAAPVTPEVFLASGSATKVPDDLAKQDHAHQAAWVNANTDFIYLGAGKQDSKLPAGFVMVYTKSGDKRIVLYGDGGSETFGPAKSAKVVADLKAGKNPPAGITR